MPLIENWKLVVLQRYTKFDGRAGRPEFWWFVLANFLISVVLNVVSLIIGIDYVLSGLYSLAVLIPSLAVGVRRLHDIDKSGWFLLIGLIPIVGWIILIVWYASPTEPAPNQYGAAPEPAFS